MPTAVVLCALSVEASAIHAHLSDLERQVHGTGTVFSVGSFSHKDVTWRVAVAECGPGNLPAATIANQALETFRPDVALFVGVAGGIKDVAIGDVVAATKVYGFHSGRAGTDFSPRPDVGQGSHRLEQLSRAVAHGDAWLDRIKPVRPTDSAPKAFVGPIAAGEQVVASTDSETFSMIRTFYSDALAVEMEGRGFLVATHVHDEADRIVIRRISDQIDYKTDADAQGN